MARFATEKKASRSWGAILSIFVFMIICFLFLNGVQQLSRTSRQRQKEALETAVQQGVAYCYALEGSYPENLDYLKEHYGLHYNEDLFFIDYRLQGGNIYPDITIIEQGDAL